MSWVAGADGWKGGWCVVLLHTMKQDFRVRIVPSFRDLLSQPEQPGVMTVDIPIGLPECTPPGGRACERDARGVLGRKASSVFSAVGRRSLEALSRHEADQLSRCGGGIGIGAQAWGLAAKLREADRFMTPERQQLVFEVHPEVSFSAMNGRAPITGSKKAIEGARQRKDALARAGFPLTFLNQVPQGAGLDDFLDACAAAWTAKRIMEGTAERFPATPERDARGLDMAIWF
jgi:predicted RNase H-like nuclease